MQILPRFRLGNCGGCAPSKFYYLGMRLIVLLSVNVVLTSEKGLIFPLFLFLIVYLFYL